MGVRTSVIVICFLFFAMYCVCRKKAAFVQLDTRVLYSKGLE